MRYSLTILMLFTLVSTALPQSGQEFKKSGILSNGRISTVFTNSGVLGQPGSKGPRFAWGHPNNGYIGDLSFIVSGTARMQKTTDFSSNQIKNLISQNKDSVFHFATICDVSRPAKAQEFDPSGNPWGFQPKAGFANPDQPSPAISDFPTTWPSGWTDFPWYNSAFKENFIETQFLLSDETDLEFNLPPFNYKPSGSNPDLTGLGLEVKTHYLLPKADDSQVGPLKNVMYLVHEVKNISDYEMNNFAFSWIFGGYIGISGSDDFPGEYDDDALAFDEATGIYYSWDFPQDNSRNPNWVGTDVGFTGMKLIGSPDSNGWTYKSRFVPANEIDLKSDESLFNQVRTNKTMPSPLFGDDGDGLMTSGEISLKPGETVSYLTVVGFGNNKTDLFRNLQNSELGWNSSFNEKGEFVSILLPDSLFNKSNQTIGLNFKLDPVADYQLSVESQGGFILKTQQIDLNLQESTSFDFSELPEGEYIIKLRPVTGDGPSDQVGVYIHNSWVSYQQESWNSLTNSISVTANPEIISNTDHYQFKMQWIGTEKGAKPGMVKVDWEDQTGNTLQRNIPYVQFDNSIVSFGIDGYSVKIDDLILADKLIDSMLKVYPDSAIIKTRQFNITRHSPTTLTVYGDSLLSFSIRKGTDNSIPWAFGGAKASTTQFTVVDPKTGRKIPFIFSENIKDGKLGVSEQLILLYEQSEDVVQIADTLRGIEGTKYRFANSIEIDGKTGLYGAVEFFGTVDSAYADFYRVPRGPVIIPVSGSTILSTKNETPTSFQIGNPYPNPFNPSVSIQISVLNQSLPVELKVFNVLGQLISSQSLLPSGNSVMTWNGKSQSGNSVPSGTYFLEFKQGTNHAVRKAVLIK
ncbi:MAG: T9SS type A sorting domain-containing protein [Bacteroidetes bacterium]|nr:T9SS type A sorting domain-containing protein [Bacteroidota bacterium]